MKDIEQHMLPSMQRRNFVLGATSCGVLTVVGAWPRTSYSQIEPVPELSGTRFNLEIAERSVDFTGRFRTATTINGGVPGPTLRWKEGDDVTIAVTNRLPETTSIHWHGLVLPWQMDGVPGLSFDGIAPGSTFTYRIPVRQSGTYWYHSHSRFQEQTGLYGALIVDPLQSDPVGFDREYVILLSDWTDEDPLRLFARLKKESHYYNYNRRTLADLAQDIRERGFAQNRRDRRMWNRMRMTDRDISDVTGATYTYLMNGQTPASNWTALFARGERVRLRIINGSAMTIFDVRIPGLEMTVVAADGQNVEPVTVDEFRIGVAETFDVVVRPSGDSAYAIFAQAIDRSGFALGSLTPNENVVADVPALDPRPVLSMIDMGMTMSMDAPTMNGPASAMSDDMHSSMSHSDPMPMTSPQLSRYPRAAVDMRAESPQPRYDDPGVGLRERSWRVLSYGALQRLDMPLHMPEPAREIRLHLTGNMMRYMWSMNGVKFSDADPIELRLGETVRFVLVNDTMMNHPIHLHGLWSDLLTSSTGQRARMHTVLVQPGQQVEYDVTANAPGPWAYHCHLLYHMDAGMFRVVNVSGE